MTDATLTALPKPGSMSAMSGASCTSLGRRFGHLGDGDLIGLDPLDYQADLACGVDPGSRRVRVL
jgi:hypothetical protein